LRALCAERATTSRSRLYPPGLRRAGYILSESVAAPEGDPAPHASTTRDPPACFIYLTNIPP